MKILCAILLLIIAGLAIALHIAMKKIKIMSEVMTEVGNMLKTIGEEAMKVSVALGYKNVGSNAEVENSDIKEEKDNE